MIVLVYVVVALVFVVVVGVYVIEVLVLIVIVLVCVLMYGRIFVCLYLHISSQCRLIIDILNS